MTDSIFAVCGFDGYFKTLDLVAGII